MALSGRVTIQEEDITGAADQSVRAVLENWSRRVGPVIYNDWQSAFFALIREHGMIDEDSVTGESAAERQARIRELYDEVLTALYGSAFRDVDGWGRGYAPPYGCVEGGGREELRDLGGEAEGDGRVGRPGLGRGVPPRPGE